VTAAPEAAEYPGWATEPEPGTLGWILFHRDHLRRALREEKLHGELVRALYAKIKAPTTGSCCVT